MIFEQIAIILEQRPLGVMTRPGPKSEPPNAAAVVNQLMARYFLRLKEATAEADPKLSFEACLAQREVKRPSATAPVSMADFLEAVKAILITGRIEGLGLRFGSRLRLADYGMAGLAVANAPTFGRAMQIVATHASYVAPRSLIHSDLAETKGRVTKTFFETHNEHWVGLYLVEQEMASMVRLVRDLLPHANLDQLRASFAYPRPRHWRLYAQHLQCSISFEKRTNQVSFPEAWMDISLENADPTLGQLIDRHCQLVVERLAQQGDLVDRVRRLLLVMHENPPSLDQAAARMGVPVHTFRRRLYQAGTSYKQIVYSVRMEMAADYLRDTTLPLQEIAYLVGYGHAPNFFNAFKKYWRKSPSQVRREHSQNAQVDRAMQVE